MHVIVVVIVVVIIVVIVDVLIVVFIVLIIIFVCQFGNLFESFYQKKSSAGRTCAPFSSSVEYITI